MSRKYFKKHIDFIKKLYLENKTSLEIVEAFNKEFSNEFDKELNLTTCGNIITRYIRADAKVVEEQEYLKNMASKVRNQKKNLTLNKENKILARNIIVQEDLEDALKNLVKEINPKKEALNKKVKKDKKKKDMAIELMLSDIHFGKKVEVLNSKGKREVLCNLDIINKRLDQFISVFKEELKEKQKQFNIERIFTNLIGDIIESYTMHLQESSVSCEFGNSRQILEAINSIFNRVIKPLAKLNIKLDINCVTGNHDRYEVKKTFNNAGENNISYQIYKVLELLCSNMNYKHVHFNIPISSYMIYDIFGNKMLIEHGDNLKNNGRVAIENLVSKRAKQQKIHIDFSRWGHFHEYTVFGRGSHIINGSVPGQDSFAEVLGFDSQACQVINYYIKTKDRPTCFYSSFPVYLN